LGEVDEEAEIISYKAVRGPNDAVRFEIRGKPYAPRRSRRRCCGSPRPNWSRL
jgi:hypothetical protein